MEFVKSVIDIVIHLDKYLNVVIQNFGNWSYLLLFVIIFAETGLVVTPFLPGDSLLFTVGAFAAQGSFNIGWLFATLAGAAIIGDTVNYALGKLFGEKILLKEKHHFIKQEHIDKTHRFFEKHGGKTIILARFIPIIRTFAPFVAGIGKMSYLKFFAYNVTGGLLWVSTLVFGGYYFANAPFVKENFSIVILAIVLVSLMPIAIEYFKHRRKKP
jgi:membrane-associated protein